MAESQRIDTGNLTNLERDVQRLLIPIEPPRAFRERLHQVLVAASSGAQSEVYLRQRRRVRAWLLSVSGVAVAVLVALQSLRMFRRRR